MSKPQNIECFETAAAGILAHLYAIFPRPELVIAKQIEVSLTSGGLLSPDCCWPESNGRPNESLASATIEWLSAEGLVRYQSGGAGRYKGCVLTSRGFTALSSPILPVESSPAVTIGESLVKAAKDGVREGLSNTIASILQSIAGG